MDNKTNEWGKYNVMSNLNSFINKKILHNIALYVSHGLLIDNVNHTLNYSNSKTHFEKG